MQEHVGLLLAGWAIIANGALLFIGGPGRSRR